MESDKMKNYNLMKQPPISALRTIGGGKLKGFTDINPQWRFEVMTTVYGACGVGWKYEIIRFWNETVGDEILAFCEIKLYIKDGEKWSDPIPGIGGNQLSSWQNKKDYNTGEQKTVLVPNDEAYKMALTDALSVAMKCLGVAADIYAGLWDGSKYRYENSDEPQQSKPAPKAEPKSEAAPKADPDETKEKRKELQKLILGLAEGNKDLAPDWLNTLTDARAMRPVKNTGELNLLEILALIDEAKKMLKERSKNA